MQYTNYGKKTVDIGAPGSLMLGIHQQGEQELGDGTSFAAPVVTAAIALVWGQHPEWDYRMVKRAILETSRPSAHLEGKCATGAVVNVEAALNWMP